MKQHGFCPSWSWQSKNSSNKLWLPTNASCKTSSLSNSLNGSFEPIDSKSWFSLKAWKSQEHQSSQNTSYPLSSCSVVDSMVKESTLKEEKPKRTNKIRKSNQPVANRCRKVRLFPNKEVSFKLKSWFGSVRKTYNWALSSINDDISFYSKQKFSTASLRKHFICKEAIPDNMSYLLDTPKHVRDGALDDLVTAYKSNFTVRSKDPNHTFEIKFRSKKDNQAITIPFGSIKSISNGEENTINMYTTFVVNAITFQIRRRDVRLGKGLGLSFDISFDSKLILDKLGRFYLSIPTHESVRDNQADSSSRHKWVALDPGVRTFQTAYSPTNGVAYKIGDNNFARIFRLCLFLDKLQGKRGKSYRLASFRLRQRIRHLVNELHCKTVYFLLSRFENILLPSFDVSNMVIKRGRKIGKKSVRNMLTWRHYDFKTMMLNRSSRMNSNVYIVGEEYTSKTCTNCMSMHPNLGGNKTYKCNSCGLNIDRDLSGSRNIFLKNMSH